MNEDRSTIRKELVRREQESPTKEELMMMVITGLVGDWNLWRENNPDIHPDLSGEDLSGLNLEGINLSNANLAGTKFCDCDLGSADLRNCFAFGANFTDAKLDSVKWEGAYLCDAQGLSIRARNTILEGLIASWASPSRSV